MFNSFQPSDRWTRSISCPLRAPHTAFLFGYYTDMVQQIKFIIHANIKPLPAIVFTRSQGHMSKVKGQGRKLEKNIVNAIT